MFDFSENTKVASIEKVPEQFRGLYTEIVLDEEAGTKEYVIADTAKGIVESVIGLNGALDKSRKESKESKNLNNLEELKEFGTSTSEIKANFQSKIEELNAQIGEGNTAKINLDKIKLDLTAGHKVELEGKEKTIDRLRKQLQEEVVGKEIVSAVAKANGEVEFIRPLLEREVKVADEDGKIKVFVVDSNNDQRYSSLTGKPMTIEERVLEMKADAQFGRLFNSKQEGGGGTPPESTHQSRPIKQTDNMSANDKIAAGLAAATKR